MASKDGLEKGVPKNGGFHYHGIHSVLLYTIVKSPESLKVKVWTPLPCVAQS